MRGQFWWRNSEFSVFLCGVQQWIFSRFSTPTHNNNKTYSRSCQPGDFLWRGLQEILINCFISASAASAASAASWWSWYYSGVYWSPLHSGGDQVWQWQVHHVCSHPLLPSRDQQWDQYQQSSSSSTSKEDHATIPGNTRWMLRWKYLKISQVCNHRSLHKNMTSALTQLPWAIIFLFVNFFVVSRKNWLVSSWVNHTLCLAHNFDWLAN